jgi:anti-sigma regulatory factor (Ser/Thr protein kinase)
LSAGDSGSEVTTTTQAAHRRFTHQALLYESQDDFLSSVVPFVLGGAQAGDCVLVVAKSDNAEALRDALGDEGGEVQFRDAETWYRSPLRTLQAFGQFVDTHQNGGRVRVVGEPVWHPRSPAAVREWVRYEAIINVALAGSSAWVVCPYDAAELPAEIVSHALATHPELADCPEATESSYYLDARALSERLDRSPLEPPTGTPEELEFERSVAGVRTLVTSEAAAAGVHWERLPELVLAVNELAKNAVRHGGGRGRLRTWVEPHSFVCEISDNGPGLPETLLGYLESEGGDEGGLWVSRRLADLLEVRSDSAGTTVRLHTSL